MFSILNKRRSGPGGCGDGRDAVLERGTKQCIDQARTGSATCDRNIRHDAHTTLANDLHHLQRGEALRPERLDSRAIGLRLGKASRGGSPFHRPARLAVGLDPGSDPRERLPAPVSPVLPLARKEFGSPVPRFRKEPGLRRLISSRVYIK